MQRGVYLISAIPLLQLSSFVSGTVPTLKADRPFSNSQGGDVSSLRLGRQCADSSRVYSRTDAVLKRAFDVFASSTGLAVLSPLFVATGVAVRLSSPGPIFFRHRRVGRGGKEFELLKFRTMRAGASGLQVTAGNDPRITPVGRLLRRSKLDELPGLINVLRGELSLVGPRPEVAKYVALYPEADREFLQRFRPGITDPAAVRFRNEEEILAQAADPERAYVDEVLPTKLAMYRAYLESASFKTDLAVIVETLRALALPRAEPSQDPARV